MILDGTQVLGLLSLQAIKAWDGVIEQAPKQAPISMTVHIIWASMRIGRHPTPASWKTESPISISQVSSEKPPP